MADDIVTRLRQMNRDDMLDQLNGTTASDWQLKREAAEEIERLESQVRMLAGLSRRLLLAGDALFDRLEDWVEDTPFDIDVRAIRAWEEARRG